MPFSINQKRWSASKTSGSGKFETFIRCSASYFLEVSARLQHEVATKGSFFEVKKTPKNLAYLRHYSKSKTEEYNENNLRVLD